MLRKSDFFAVSGFFASALLCCSFGFMSAEVSSSPVKKQDDKDDRYKALDKLSRAIGVVQSSYVNDLPIEEVVDKAISGLMANLDAHSLYLKKKDYEELTAKTKGSFSGIGISVGIKNGALTIIAPLDDTPAERVGLKSGDIILKIDDKSAIDMNLDQAVSLMKGKKGTKVKLTIVRKGEKKPIVFDITRDNVRIKSAHVKRIQDTRYAYLRISSFDSNVTNTARTELGSMDGIDGIVMDLRNNPGGLLNQAVELTSLFIKGGVVLFEKGKNLDKEIRATGDAPFRDIPLVVLVDGGSASASEIVSGSLQDHKRAVIVGEQTFGKGSVQQVIRLGSDDALKLTTAKYYLPSGRSIQAVGIKPNIVVAGGAVSIDEDQELALKEANLRLHLKNEFLSSEGGRGAGEDSADFRGMDKAYITKSMILRDVQLKSAIDVLKSWPIISNSNSSRVQQRD